CLGRRRGSVPTPPRAAPRHLGRGLDRGPSRTLGAPDRCTPAVHRWLLVWLARPERIGLPRAQRGGLAVAADPPRCADPCCPPPVGLGGGHAVGAGLWDLRRRCNGPRLAPPHSCWRHTPGWPRGST